MKANHLFAVLLVEPFVAGILAVSIILGCSGCDSRLAENTVQTAYPGGEVRKMPGMSYDFVVRTTNGDVIYIRDYGFANGALSTNLLFAAPK